MKRTRRTVKSVIKNLSDETGFDRLENRFDRLEDKFDKMTTEINGWRSIFETKLTELNVNMKGVLERLTQHDFRFSEHAKRIEDLENSKIKDDTKKQTVNQLVTFGWWAARCILGAGILIGGLIGAAGAWKIVFGS